MRTFGRTRSLGWLSTARFQHVSKPRDGEGNHSKKNWRNIQQSNTEQMPIKDRSPPAAYDPRNPKRKLAVLVDAQKIDADVFCKSIEPVIGEVGVPVLIRLFDYDLNSKWQSITAGGLADAGSDGQSVPRRSAVAPSIEWFRVERFIPISMQLAADANHIFDFRNFNRIDGVCYVCTELERPQYEAILMNRLKGRGFNQYLFDELGLAAEVLDDGRSRDGSPQ